MLKRTPKRMPKRMRQVLKRPYWLLLVVGFLALLALTAQPVGAEDPPGAKLYATYCAACHGAGGKNGLAPAVGSAEYLAKNDDQAIIELTRQGAPSKGMPAWSKSKGGTLSDEQIAEIVAYLRSPTSAVTSPAATTETQAVASNEYAQTKMTVTESIQADGGLAVIAQVQRNDGSPVTGATVAFERVTTFGNVDLGTVKTDKSGSAKLVLYDVPEAGRLVDVQFKGSPDLGSSAGRIVLQTRRAVTASSGPINLSGVRLSIGEEPLLAPEGSLITPNPPMLPALLFALVVACVWATYGYVVYQMIGIRTSGTRGKQTNTLTLTRKAR